MVDPLGVKYHYGYTARGDADTLTFPGPSGTDIASRIRTYDNDGNVATEQVLVQGAALRSVTVTSDARGKMLTSFDTGIRGDTLFFQYSGLGALIADNTWYWGVASNGNPLKTVNNEIFVNDPLGNRLSGMSTGGGFVQDDATGGWHHNPFNTASHYQNATGRLLGDISTGNFTGRDTTYYDAAGNITFATQIPRGTGQLADRASFYDADNRVAYADYRTAVDTSNQSGQINGNGLVISYTRSFNTYRYDAFGRQVLVLSSRTCENISLPSLCKVSWISRLVWDGMQKVAESMIDSATSVEVDTSHTQLAVGNIDLNPYFGRVFYTFGIDGTDHPLVAARIDYADASSAQAPDSARPYLLYPPVDIVPVWNSSGQINPVISDLVRRTARGSCGVPSTLPRTGSSQGRRCPTRS